MTSDYGITTFVALGTIATISFLITNSRKMSDNGFVEYFATFLIGVFVALVFVHYVGGI